MTSNSTFSFMKFRNLYFGISLVVLIPGLISLLLFGLKPSIDFTGGSLLAVEVSNPAALKDVSTARFQTVVGTQYELTAVQASGERELILRGKPISNEQKLQALAELQKTIGPVKELRFESVGPILGRELLEKMILAGVLVATMIAVYIWHQFHDLKYGVSAVLAMLHDSFVLLGAFSLLGHFFHVEVDVLFVTALLTTLSFSVHDTIVVYDRIREVKRKHSSLPFIQVVDVAVLETLGRSINNSMTIIMMLLTLVLLGGQTIHWFAVALLIGAVTGTYSSTFTAAPLLLLWDEVKAKRKKH